MGFTGCTDPAAILAWEIGEDSVACFSKRHWSLACFVHTYKQHIRWWFPTCLHFLHLIALTGVAALWGGHHFSGPVNQITVQSQSLRPFTYWHITVTLTGALVAENVVSAHAVALGIKLHHRLTTWRRERGWKEKRSLESSWIDKQSQAVIKLMLQCSFFNAVVRIRTLTNALLSPWKPAQRVKAIKMRPSLQRTAHCHRDWQRGYKCSGCLVICI